jgi:hypothetical protein
MKSRARQTRDGRLQGVKAIVERQQRMASGRDDQRLVDLEPRTTSRNPRQHRSLPDETSVSAIIRPAAAGGKGARSVIKKFDKLLGS